MNRAALIVVCVALTAGSARSQDRPPEPQPLACVPRPRARELLFEKKLMPPFRIMRQAGFLTQAEPIDIQLCWFHGGLVYDVTLLARDGRVLHRLLAAATGEPLGDRPKP